MGEPWFKMHRLTDRVELVNLEQSWSGTFENSWSQHMTQQIDDLFDFSQMRRSRVNARCHPQPKHGAHLKRRPKVKAKAKATTKGPVKTIDPELNKKLVATSEMKTSYHHACSEADHLLTEMFSSSSWSWASAFGEELVSNNFAPCESSRSAHSCSPSFRRVIGQREPFVVTVTSPTKLTPWPKDVKKYTRYQPMK